MLAIRFERVGRKNKAQFRVVLQEHRIAPGGRHIAVLGSYDPHQKKAVLKTDKIKEWISKGAQVSNSVYNLLIKEGAIEGKKRAIKMKKPEVKTPTEPEKKEEEKTEKPKDEVKAEEAKSEEPVAETKEEVKAEEAKPEEPKIEEADK
jgi:small subunit ribosomal protein S16